jgi:sulfoxide reductase catalytic subunit YedY
MKKRRQFLEMMLGFITSTSIMFNPFFAGIRFVYASTQKIILPKGTKRNSLINKNPSSLDTRNLEITPLEGFRTMGITGHVVNLEKWRLEVGGHVQTPLRLRYSDILDLPSIEKNVLLICPGVFVNHGQWKGIAIMELLKMAGMENGVTQVTARGPAGDYEKVEHFLIEDIISKKVFLAYQVNGETLPRKHGFPLRVVAEDHYGFEWVKYVYRITAD